MYVYMKYVLTNDFIWSTSPDLVHCRVGLEGATMHPWGCVAYVHNVSHEYGKLSPKGKKYIFIRYSESSKGYIFFGEDINGNVTEIESQDVIFIEEDFMGLDEIDRDTHFYEMEDPVVDEGVRIID